ncbi:MAG: pyridoxamine 5'-phosphate oxidase family protein [Clostridiales bacterium]|nr:pyridoxamine 5'-phosphate oxidase family protein [Clostridiales bacterium]
MKELNAERCLQILREVKEAAFATVDENGQPQVRVIDVMLIEKSKLYFCTSRGKDFYKQLMSNPYVAVVTMNRDYQSVRLKGKAERLENQKYWIDRIFEENPSMKGVYPGDSRYILEPFCIENGQLEFFDLSKEPIYRRYFSTGNEKTAEKGFEITDLCVGCGKCSSLCPQKCIKEGLPYEIRQEHCLHCGLCFENCPVSAIIKRGEQK